MNNEEQSLVDKYTEGNFEIKKPEDDSENEIVVINEPATSSDLLNKYMGEEVSMMENTQLEIKEEPLEEIENVVASIPTPVVFEEQAEIPTPIIVNEEPVEVPPIMNEIPVVAEEEVNLVPAEDILNNIPVYTDEPIPVPAISEELPQQEVPEEPEVASDFNFNEPVVSTNDAVDNVPVVESQPAVENVLPVNNEPVSVKTPVVNVTPEVVPPIINPVPVVDNQAPQVAPTLEPVTLEQNVGLPEPAELNDIISGLPQQAQPEVNLYEEINNLNKESGEFQFEPDNGVPENNDNAKKPSKGKRIFVMILAIIILLAATFLGVFFVYSSNYKNVVARSFTHLLTYADSFDAPIEIDGDKKITSGETSFHTSIDSLNAIKDVTLKWDAIVNERDYQLDLDIKEDKEEKLKMQVLLKDEKFYALFKELFDKYIYTEVETGDEEITKDDIEYTIEKTMKLLVTDIKKESYSSENTKIMIDGKEVSARKTLVTLNPKDRVELYNKVITELKKDPKITFLKSFETTVLDSDDKTVLKYAIYTKGLTQKVVGLNFETYSKEKDYDAIYESDCYDEECESKIPLKEVINKIEYRIGEKKSINVYNGGELTVGTEISTKGNITTFDIKSTSINGTILYTNDNLNRKASISLSSGGSKIDMVFDLTFKEIKEDEKYDGTFDFSLQVKTDSSAVKSTFEMNNKFTTEKASKEITVPKNIIKYEDVTEEQMTDIQTKLSTILADLFDIDYNALFGDTATEDALNSQIAKNQQDVYDMNSITN